MRRLRTSVRRPSYVVRHLVISARQEAQLSQRDRAMLRVIEYFAKSLKVTKVSILTKDEILMGWRHFNKISAKSRSWRLLILAVVRTICSRSLYADVGLHCNCMMLDIPRTTTSLGDRAFAVAGPRVWNSLPPVIRDPSLSPSIFGKLLKTCLFKGRGAGDLWTGALEMYWLTN